METTVSPAPHIFHLQVAILHSFYSTHCTHCTLDIACCKQCCRFTEGFGVGHNAHLKCCTVNIYQTFMSYRFAVCLTGLTQCLAMKHLTVMRGDTLTLTCRLKKHHTSSPVEWKNPENFSLFFNKIKGRNSAWATICIIIYDGITIISLWFSLTNGLLQTINKIFIRL